MLFDYFSLSIKNVRKRGVRSWLTMLGIFLGIAAVVSLISLGQGLQTAIAGQFGATVTTDVLTIMSAETGFGPPGATAVRKLTEHDLELIRSIPGVEKAVPRLIRIVTAEYNKEIIFTYAGSMPDDSDFVQEMYDTLNVEIAEGKFLEAADHGKIFLGDDFTSEEMFGKKLRVGDRLKVQGKDFEIVGFAKRASTFTINSAIFMTEDDMKELLNIDDEIDMIIAVVEDSNRIEQVASDIERKMRKDRDQKPGEEDFAVQTPLQSLESVNTVLSIVNIIVSGIAAIALLIGGIGIANTMFTSVLERTREIGVMKAIGAQNKDILAIFLIEAGLLGLVGGIVGAAIGLGLAITAAQAANTALNNTIFTINPSVPLLVASIAFSFLIGIFSGIVPAWQASKLNPVEALRR